MSLDAGNIHTLRAPIDRVLVPAFHLLRSVFGSTLLLLYLTCSLLPLYLLVVFVRLAPQVIVNLPSLLTRGGRHNLVTEASNAAAADQAQRTSQLSQTYNFPAAALQRSNPLSAVSSWTFPHVALEVDVCGASARITHLKPAADAVPPSGTRVLLLACDSHIWRHTAQKLLALGHEVFALDLLGHGRSDKFFSGGEITFALHARTIVSAIERVAADDGGELYIAAHGFACLVTLSAIPLVDDSIGVNGLCLINAWIPSVGTRVAWSVGLKERLLLFLLYILTGLLGISTPIGLGLRLLSPGLDTKAIQGYTSPYDQCMVGKSSIPRACHMFPLLPEVVYELLNHPTMKLVIGLTGSKEWNSLREQAYVRRCAAAALAWWQSEGGVGIPRDHMRIEHTTARRLIPEKLYVVSCENDVLFKSSGRRLKSVMPRRCSIRWLAGVGHLALEERPDAIARVVDALIDGRGKPVRSLREIKIEKGLV